MFVRDDSGWMYLVGDVGAKCISGRTAERVGVQQRGMTNSGADWTNSGADWTNSGADWTNSNAGL